MSKNPWGLTPAVELLAWHLVVTFPRLRISSGRRRIPLFGPGSAGLRSKHLTGRAIDLVGPGVDMRAALFYARTELNARGLIHDAGTGLHLHLEW